MRHRAVVILLAFVFIAGRPEQPLWAATDGPSTASPVYAADPIPSPRYRIERIYTPALQFPERVAVSPSGAIIIVFEGNCTAETADSGHRLIRTHEDGSLSAYGPVIDECYRAITFDADSNLYAVDHNGLLYKVTPQGTATEVATGVVVGDLAAAPSGDIFAGGEGMIQRITPQGQVSVYASGSFFVWDIAVSPTTGGVYFSDSLAGEVYRVRADGGREVLVSGLSPEPSFPWLAFSPDDTLYLNSDFDGTFEVSLADGALTELPWFHRSVLTGQPRGIDVDGQGRVVSTEHGYGHVFRFDMQAETAEVIYENVSNSTALAVAPSGGGVHMGIISPLPTGSGRVVRIEPDGSLTTVLDGLPSHVRRIAFDGDGLGYIASRDPIASRDIIISTMTLSGEREDIHTHDGRPSSLAVHPLTGDLWWSEGDALWYLDGARTSHRIPYSITSDPRPKPDLRLAFTPDGTLYTRYTGPQGDIPVEQGIYRVDLSGPAPTNELVADMSSINLCCCGGNVFTAASDGNLYWVGDGDRFTVDHEYDFHLLQITPAGEVTLIARNLGVDPFSIAADPDSTDIYFTTSQGVWRVFEEEMVFLPQVSRGVRS